jgi:N-hydroxyarylamine O-acetyltransferase
MNLRKYLDRIGFMGSPNVSIDTLKELHEKHMYSVPFENLDIHTGKEIKLNLENFENKIINLKRGGFCYELNGLFYDLLKSIGFDVKMVSGRVINEEDVPGAEFDHMVLIVKIEDEEYLADVGFGDSFISPLWINPDYVNEDSAGYYQIVKEDENNLKLLRSQDGVLFTPKYLFSMEKRELNEFEKMCEYHQTSPKSHFTKNKLCSQANKNGRITLINNKLIITRDKEREEIPVHGEEEFNENLMKYFGLRI